MRQPFINHRQRLLRLQPDHLDRRQPDITIRVVRSQPDGGTERADGRIKIALRLIHRTKHDGDIGRSGMIAGRLVQDRDRTGVVLAAQVVHRHFQGQREMGRIGGRGLPEMPEAGRELAQRGFGDQSLAVMGQRLGPIRVRHRKGGLGISRGRQTVKRAATGKDKERSQREPLDKRPHVRLLALLVLVPQGLHAFLVLMLRHLGPAFFLDGTHSTTPLRYSTVSGPALTGSPCSTGVRLCLPPPRVSIPE